jgi:hypothetical protein
MKKAHLSILAAAAGALAACTSSTNPPPTPSFSTSAAVTGAQDSHCNGKPAQDTSQASCHPDAAAPVEDAAAGDAATPDAGGGDAGADNPYRDTMFDSEGDDDDCKYHVKWASTAVAQSTDATFQVTATRKSDGQPATAAKPRLEVFLTDTHPAPNSKQAPTEMSPGVYMVGPIRFDASGRWTVRVHLYEDCEDLLDDSPHGHAAFYVSVP